MSIISEFQGLFTSALKLINQLRENVVDHYNPKSLTQVTKLLRVEPLTITSSDLVNLENIKDINLTLLNIFCGYYLSAVNLLTAVRSVEVVRLLDKLNPDRDGTALFLSAGMESASFSMEAYKHSLLPQHQPPKFSFEDAAQDTIKAINEISSASVGRQLAVTMCTNQQELKDNPNAKPDCATFPVNVRLAVSPMPQFAVVRFLASLTDDFTLTERWYAWREGRISGIADLIFCRDAAREYRKMMIEDKTGNIQEVLRRVSNAKKYGVLSKNPTMMAASQIYVISEADAAAVEFRMGGKLSNVVTRNKVFNNCYAMLICVVDREKERVTIYADGIAAGTTLTFKEIKSSDKRNGPDILEIMKAFQNSAPPVF